jgi:hypothetical protein
MSFPVVPQEASLIGWLWSLLIFFLGRYLTCLAFLTSCRKLSLSLLPASSSQELLTGDSNPVLSGLLLKSG